MKIVLLLIVILIAYITRAQTNPVPQNLPYSQDFGTSAFNTLSQGISVWNGVNGTSVNTQTIAEQTIPSGNATIVARTAPTTTGGAFGLSSFSNARLYIQSSSNATEGLNQPVISFYSGLTHRIKISFDVELIEAGTGRSLGLVVQYRAGTSGPWTTLPNSSRIYNNTSQNADDVDLNGDVDSYTWILSGLSANTNYQLCVAHWRSGSAGSSVGLAYDNIHLYPFPNSYDILGGGLYCAGGMGLPVKLSSSQTGVRYQLFHNGTAIGTEVEGTGSELDFGLQQQQGSYLVKAFFPGGDLIPMAGEVNVEIQQPPSASYAGEDQVLCGETTTILSADLPALGLGIWSQLSGTEVDFSDLLSHNPTISNLSPGEYIFRWSVEYGICPSSVNDVMILVLAPPSQSEAGENLKVCNNQVQLNAQLPASGQGTWSKLSGPGEVLFENQYSHNSLVSVTIPGSYQFEWTVGNGICVSTTDQVEVNFNEFPVLLSASPVNQTKFYGEHIEPVNIKFADPGEDATNLSVEFSYRWNNGSIETGLPGNLILELVQSGETEKEWRLFSGSGMNYPYVGSYEISLKISDGCLATVVQTIRLEILPANVDPVADAYYTGPCFFWSNTNSKIASLTLAATLKNSQGTVGDIRTARVSFYSREGNTLIPINGAQDLAVGLINPGNPGLGSASVTVQYNLGSSNVSVLNIAVLVGGNYSANDPATDKTITVAVPVPGGQICGGINILNIQSQGIIAGAAGWETNAGFSLQYNNSLKNPQGKVEIKLLSYRDRFGVAGTEIRTYIIRSNSISSFSLNGHVSQFSGKANLSEIIDGVEQAVEGNCMLQLQLSDGDLLQTIQPDQVAITLYRSKGGVWYSSNWNASSSQMQNILNGNLTLGNGAANQKIVLGEPAGKINKYSGISVFPNPCKSEFIISIPKYYLNDAANILITDVFGRVIKSIYTKANEKTIRLGGDLQNGVYIVQISHGVEVQRVVLVKQ